MIEREIDRLYELIRLEEKKREIENKIAELIKKKAKLEESRRKRQWWLLRACRSLLAILLALIGSSNSVETPYARLLLFFGLLILLDFLLGRVIAVFQRLQVHKVFQLIKKLMKRDEDHVVVRSRYKRAMDKLGRQMSKYEKDLGELVEKIKQKAAFLPANFQNLESYQSLFDYLYFEQVESFESALLLHGQQFRHNEHMNNLKELRQAQVKANEQLRALEAKIAALTSEVDQLKKKVEG